jgi:putative Holliday junction resolvase
LAVSFRAVHSPPEHAARVILAFDFGLRRIGVAAGDTITRSAAPVDAIRCSDSGPDWPSLDRLLKSYAPRQLVVGSPYNADGTPGTLSKATDEFAASLTARYQLPVARVDERWSSMEASAELKARRQSGARRHRVQREDIDSLAAAIILERWLAGED